MKKVIIFLIIFSLFSVGTGYLKTMNSNLVGKRIVIDVGHGGKDSGTVYKDIKEKDINLSIGFKLKEVLIKNGVDVVMTREGDYDLAKPNANRRKKSDFDNRIELINNSGADMYISIHINYLGDSKYYGVQTFYTKSNKDIGETIQEVLKKDLDSPMDARLLSNDIYMYKKLNIPGVLIECGFLSNAKERSLLIGEEYQWTLVKSIVDGMINYY